MKSIKSKFVVVIITSVVFCTAVSGAVSIILFRHADDSQLGTCIAISVTVNILLTLSAVFYATRIAGKIIKPLLLCVDRLESIAKGDFHSPMPEINTEDEVKIMRDAGEKIVDNIGAIVNDEARVLGAMAKGDLCEVSDGECYVGDLVEIHDSLMEISKNMNKMLGNMAIVGSQVASGSDQVAGGAQELSQGATEQAASVEQLAATLNDLNEEIKETREFAGDVNKVTSKASDELKLSHEKMDELINAMTIINDSSEKIGVIIKTIEDIAFQTNILALNAAVEAARAGQAGKGFAVVADEVRNLAEKSAEASKSTSELIEQSREAVNNGSKIANDAYQLMDETMADTIEVVSAIDNIFNAAVKQETAIEQITTGVDQISAVVQNNSSTAEESAASSEQLSSQADNLLNAIGKFNLAKN